jgi:hypothetical protein
LEPEKLMNARTICGCRSAWALAGLYILAVAVSAGCSLPEKQGSVETLTTAEQFNEVSIVYRTESDRVNLAAAGYSEPAQFVSLQQPSPGLLPNVTTTTLQIRHPHPDGIPGYACARVIVQPNGAEESEGRSMWSRLFGSSDNQSEANHNAQIVEAWLLDIPAWQVNGIMTKLQQQNFFRRAKVLDAEAFLAVKADGAGFAKNYRSVPELDALILRVRREGRPAAGPPHSSAQPPRGPVQPTYVPAHPTYRPAQPTYNPAEPSYGPTHRYAGPASRLAAPAPSAAPPMTRQPSPNGRQIW